MNILLYSPKKTERLRYVTNYLFAELLGIAIELTDSKKAFLQSTVVCINYSAEAIRSEEIWLIPHGLLAEEGIRSLTVECSLVEGVPVCFGVGPGGVLPFDPLAASFFMLSRYEEYLSYEPDSHDRFPAEVSWACRNNTLEKPIVWEWLKLLITATKRHYPSWIPDLSSRTYQFCPTYDIDIPWAYRQRGWRGLVRANLEFFQFNWSALDARVKSWIDAKKDPFYTFPQLQKLHALAGIRPQVFWLVGDRATFDINPSYQLPAVRDLLKEVSSWSDTGLHPSYAGGQDAQRINTEKARLENIVQHSVKDSRQHFLRLSLPNTYRQLLAAGIEADHSMGYAARTGYRAGTSEPFFWYDLEQEKITTLRIYPFAVMDVTLKNYMNLSPEAAQAHLRDLQQYCKQEGLRFCTLWHNSSFSELHGWKGWWPVYQSLFST